MRQLEWMGNSLKNLSRMPEDVRGEFGHGLFLAQIGLIPTCIDQNSRAPVRRPMVMMRQG